MSKILGFKIEPEQVYTTEEIMAFFRIVANDTLRRFRQRGLISTTLGKRHFYKGSDILNFIDQNKT